MNKLAVFVLALAAGVAHARNEEFLDGMGSGGLSMGAIRLLMVALGLLLALRAPFERVSYGRGWMGRAVACSLSLAFALCAWLWPAPAMILCVVGFTVLVAVLSLR